MSVQQRDEGTKHYEILFTPEEGTGLQTRLSVKYFLGPLTTHPDANQVTCVPKYFCYLAQE